MIFSGIKKMLKSFRRANHGSALVEFSLLLPLLFTMMAGCLEFGRVLHQFHILNKGVTNAARYIARVEEASLCNPVGTAIPSSTLTTARAIAQKGKITAVDADPYIIADWNASSTFTAIADCTTNTQTGGVSDFRGPDEITKIIVSTSFQYQDIGMLSLLSILPGAPEFAENRLISATHTELYIGG